MNNLQLFTLVVAFAVVGSTDSASTGRYQMQAARLLKPIAIRPIYTYSQPFVTPQRFKPRPASPVRLCRKRGSCGYIRHGTTVTVTPRPRITLAYIPAITSTTTSLLWKSTSPANLYNLTPTTLSPPGMRSTVTTEKPSLSTTMKPPAAPSNTSTLIPSTSSATPFLDTTPPPSETFLVTNYTTTNIPG